MKMAKEQMIKEEEEARIAKLEKNKSRLKMGLKRLPIDVVPVPAPLPHEPLVGGKLYGQGKRLAFDQNLISFGTNKKERLDESGRSGRCQQNEKKELPLSAFITTVLHTTSTQAIIPVVGSAQIPGGPGSKSPISRWLK